VFQRRGIRDLRDLLAAELNPAARVGEIEIDIDVRKLDAELEGVLAPQPRDAVLKIGIRILEIDGTAAPTAQRSKRPGCDLHIRKATGSRDAGVKRIVLAICDLAGVKLSQREVKEVVAKAGFVHQAGRCGPNPTGA